MLIDKFWLERELTNKFETLTLHTIVNEAFIGALPFDKNELDDKAVESLSEYSLGVLKKLGGFQLVKSAMESCDDVYRGFFLKDLYLICNTSAMEAMKRVRGDEEISKKDRSESANIIDEAAFTDSEYKSFVSSADTLNLDKVSEVIEQKTIKVLKQEKEEYIKEVETNQRLKDAYIDVKGENATTEESFESFIGEIIPRGKAKHYTSLFSKLQSSALNAVMVYESDTSSELPMKAIDHVTNHKFLNKLREPKSKLSVLEDLVPAVAIESYFDSEDKTSHMNKATIAAITIYTMFETLKTMGLYSPDTKEAENYILDKVDTLVGEDGVRSEIEKIVKSITDEIKSIKNKDDLVTCRSEVEQVRDLVDANTIITDKDAVFESLNVILESINDKIDDYDDDDDEDGDDDEDDLFEKKRKERDLSSVNRLNTTMGKDPFVKIIRFIFEKSGYDCPPDITVEGITESGVCKKNAVISMESQSSTANPKDYIKGLIENSKLNSASKNIEFYTTMVGSIENIM